MPTKKFPDTDDERLRALRCAIEQEDLCSIYDLAISLKTLHETKALLLLFEGAYFDYKRSLEDEEKANDSLVEQLGCARLYIAHFIQVLNLAVIRNEIKAETKSFYGLNTDNHTRMPDLHSKELVLEWGQKIIKGESERVSRGGAPIYNPTIAKVKVHCDVFQDVCQRHKIYSQNTTRTQDALLVLREKVDETISTIWNQVEEKFKRLPTEVRMEKCRKYGIQYHYEKGEQINVFY